MSISTFHTTNAFGWGKKKAARVADEADDAAVIASSGEAARTASATQRKKGIGRYKCKICRRGKGEAKSQASDTGSRTGEAFDGIATTPTRPASKLLASPPPPFPSAKPASKTRPKWKGPAFLSRIRRSKNNKEQPLLADTPATPGPLDHSSVALSPEPPIIPEPLPLISDRSDVEQLRHLKLRLKKLQSEQTRVSGQFTKYLAHMKNQERLYDEILGDVKRFNRSRSSASMGALMNDVGKVNRFERQQKAFNRMRSTDWLHQRDQVIPAYSSEAGRTADHLNALSLNKLDDAVRQRTSIGYDVLSANYENDSNTIEQIIRIKNITDASLQELVRDLRQHVAQFERGVSMLNLPDIPLPQ